MEERLRLRVLYGGGGRRWGSEVPAPTWQAPHWRRPALRVGSAALVAGCLVQYPVELPVRASPLGDNNESTHPEGRDLPGTGAISLPLGHYLPEHPCPRDADVVRHEMVLFGRRPAAYSPQRSW